MIGYIETVTPAFATGWAVYTDGRPSFMVAALGDEILGVAVADEMRADVAAAAEQAGTKAACFSILFNREISPAEQVRVAIHFIQNRAPLPRVADFKMDRYPVLRVFVLGSPRSGTSALGTALTKITQLPWHGELHAAQIFAGPAALLLRGKGTNPEVGAFLAQPQFTAAMRKQARLVYFGLHKSASFLDKTPGVPMIRSAPFMASCFPDAKFIYLRRNGVANILSRMAKFGGDNLAFQEHCADWAQALNDWTRVRASLPSYLELQQEEMLADPAEAARQIALYLGTPDLAEPLASELADDAVERTGAGIGRSALGDTGWDETRIGIFKEFCGPTMIRFGYRL